MYNICTCNRNSKCFRNFIGISCLDTLNISTRWISMNTKKWYSWAFLQYQYYLKVIKYGKKFFPELESNPLFSLYFHRGCGFSVVFHNFWRDYEDIRKTIFFKSHLCPNFGLLKDYSCDGTFGILIILK